MPKKSKRVSRRRVSRRRVSRHRRYRLSSLRDWPRVVAPGVPPPQIKDCGDYTWRVPQPGINTYMGGGGCPSWKLTGYVSPYTRAARISRSNHGRVAAARRDALNKEKLSVERVYSQAEGLLLPSEIAVLERRLIELDCARELPVGSGAPWENPKSRARLCKRNHHRNCKCGKRDWIFLPDSSGWTD